MIHIAMPNLNKDNENNLFFSKTQKIMVCEKFTVNQTILQRTTSTVRNHLVVWITSSLLRM